MDESEQERSSDIEFEAVAQVSIPDAILSNDRDYLNECISIINHCTKRAVSSTRYRPDESTYTTHFVLYAFIALSLVIEADEDVCAVAVYLYHNRTEVFYAKNWALRDRDIAHATEFATLIRSTAMGNIGRAEFQEKYFEFIMRSARAKFMRRFGEFKAAIKETIKDAGVLPDFVDDMMKILRALDTKNITSIIRNNADKEVASCSPTNSIYNGLLYILDNCKSSVDKDKTLDDFMRLAFNAYVVGNSTVTIDICQKRPTFNNFLQCLQKFGIYYRGSTRLFLAITENAHARKLYSQFTVQGFNPLPELRVELEQDWWTVLQTVYYRGTKQMIPITRGQFTAKYDAAIRDYVNPKNKIQRFQEHCEVSLIRHLSASHGPTELGISKACCPACFVYISGVNQFRESMRLSTWIIGNRHDQIYNWQCAHSDVNGKEDLVFEAGAQAVRNFVTKEIIRLIKSCRTKKPNQSPSYQSDPEIDMSEPDGRRFHQSYAN
jgi:hypothetical protein